VALRKGESPVDTGEYNQKVDDTLAAIEDALDICEADLDWDFAGGILTIECANGSQVIINRQAPTQQIWLAARAGGFHFSYDAADDCWKQDGLELFAQLNKCLSEQSGEAVTLAAP
jgi:iron-sulfur cluster assembly protein CyaY